MYTLVIGRAFPSEETGMMGIFEFEQAAALKKYGMDTVYAFCDTRSVKSLRKLNYQSFEKENVPVYGYHFPIGGAPRKILDFLKYKKYEKLLRTIIKNHGRPSYIHIHFPLLTLNDKIWLLLKSLQIPIVVTEHWTKVQKQEIEPFRVQLLQEIVEEAKAFICVSELLKNSVLELTNTIKEITVIPNMLNKNFYFDEKIKANPDEFHFIAIGRIAEVKRFEFTVEAFSKAFPDNDNLKLNIVGNGPLYNQVEQRIKELNMENRIIMHGFLQRDKTADLLRRSDAFVSASVLETFGVPFIEAMACGKPVIGVLNGPLDEHILRNSGILFKPDNMEDLVAKLIRIYEEKNEVNSNIISEYALSNFSECAVSRKILNLYNKRSD